VGLTSRQARTRDASTSPPRNQRHAAFTHERCESKVCNTGQMSRSVRKEVHGFGDIRHSLIHVPRLRRDASSNSAVFGAVERVAKGEFPGLRRVHVVRRAAKAQSKKSTLCLVKTEPAREESGDRYSAPTAPLSASANRARLALRRFSSFEMRGAWVDLTRSTGRGRDSASDIGSGRPPHRSQRAALPHWALASGSIVEALLRPGV
jgi:hypothetical protein